MSFLHVEANYKIRGVDIFQYIYLYKAYADDATFLKNKNSFRQLIESFSEYSCLKPNYEKCEIAEIRALKSVKVAVCGRKCVDSRKDTVTITGVYCSYYKTKQDEKNFLETITKIQNAKSW